MTRITVVLEYANDNAVPRIGLGTKDFGDFRVYALQFGDALLELECLHELSKQKDIDAAYDEAKRRASPRAGESHER